MRTSQFLLTTLREKQTDAELVSHQLMIRAGLIRKLSSGIFTWLPLGYRVLTKLENIIREELNKVGAMEIQMPNIQPAELWKNSGRWEKYGNELLKIRDRAERDFVFAPTHEEVITTLMRGEIRSYKQLPLVLYQIHTKFRDEIRPRFGVMRAREFIMQDAYSFDLDGVSMQQTYAKMLRAYQTIFTRLGFDFRMVQADSGAIGGDISHEFQVIADAGEDTLVFSDTSNYAANLETATALAPVTSTTPSANMEKIATPNCRTIKQVSDYLSLPATQMLKALLVKGTNNNIVALFLRGDHELNLTKAEHHPLIATPLTFVDEKLIAKEIGAPTGFIGPIGLAEKNIPVLIDRDAAALVDFCCGGNEKDQHYINANWQRDCPLPLVADLRNVIAGDVSPDGKGILQIKRGIEVGHIFQLGNHYSKLLGATVVDKHGKAIPLQMGCYGIGVSRIVAAAIEQHHDERGIIWTPALAPFDIALVPMNYYKSQRVREVIEQLYQELINAGFDVLLDDRRERAGVLFADSDLIGIPHRLVMSERGIDANTIEYKARTAAETQTLPKDQVVDFLRKVVTN